MPEEPLDPRSAAVRDLLREARADEPMPPDVAARLDAALADEARGTPTQAGSAQSGPAHQQPPATDVEATGRGDLPARPGAASRAPAEVTDLAARRRRRRVTVLLAAAAVVVAVGVGVPVVTQVTNSSDADSSAGEDNADGSAEGADAPSEESQEESNGSGDGSDSQGDSAQEDPDDGEGATSTDEARAALTPYAGTTLSGDDLELRPATMTSDLEALLSAAADDPEPAPPGQSCAVEIADDEVGILTSYEGEPAVFVVYLDPARGALGSAFDCASGAAIATIR